MKLAANLLKNKKMKHNISLSLKKALRIALPCLALSLFSVSCSSDDSMVLPEKTTIGKTISFTAVASELTEDYSTRVGLDGTNLPSSNLAPEPIIWLVGDKFAFNFVKYGEATGQVIEYTASAVWNGGLYCSMTPGQDMDLENGLYQVYVLTPNTSGTFQGNAVSGTVIDLRGQSQPNGTSDYSNLSDYYYQSAYTILEIKDNEVVTGSTNLKFTGLTSMLRYQVTSNLANEVTVKKIKIDHAGDSPYQFHTRGYFDPSTGTSVVPAGSAIPTLSITTDESLEPSSAFNAYMTLLPTEGFASGDYNLLSVTVYFYQGSVLYKRTWDWNASAISNNGTFPVESRYMFDLTLRPTEISLANPNDLEDLEEEELTDNEDGDIYSDGDNQYVYYNGQAVKIISINDVYYTLENFNQPYGGAVLHTFDGFYRFDSLDSPFICPPGWTLLSVHNMSNDARKSLLIEINFPVGMVGTSGRMQYEDCWQVLDTPTLCHSYPVYAGHRYVTWGVNDYDYSGGFGFPIRCQK